MADQMLATRTEEAPPSRVPRRYGTPGVFGAAFVAVLALLLARNPGVFTLHVAERGDAAANSLLVEQAKHFHLLVGNYSRVGFSHPGPAFFYLDAVGEWLGYDVLHALPSPYNGQWLAAMVINAALVAAVVAVMWTWSRSWRAVAWCGAAVLVFVGIHTYVFSSTWMPFVYVAPFLLFLVAAASVAAGRTGHSWLLVLAGGLLIHGHAEFLVLFVPAIALAVVAVLWYRRRRQGSAGPFVPRHWLAALGVAAVFALPMVLNLVLHFPGEYRKYLGYGGKHASTHGLGADLKYVLFFWYPQRVAAGVALIALFGVTTLLARRQRDAQLRRFLACGAGAVALATVLFLAYTIVGIDTLASYVGYFYWAAPLALVMFAAVAASALVPRRVDTALSVAALAAAAVFASLAPAPVARPDRNASVPGVIGSIAAASQGRPAVLALDHDAWPTMTALMIAGERAGQRVCVEDRGWQFMVTRQYVCTPGEVSGGMRVTLGMAPGSSTVRVSFGATSISMPDNTDS